MPLRSVTSCGVLVAPTLVALKERLVGDALALEVTPVPKSATDWGLLPAESLNVNVAERPPVAEGLNAILTVQLEDAARVAPHDLLEMAKSAEFAPEIPILLTLIATGPVLSVTDCNGLVEPTAVVAKDRLAGATVAFELAGAGEPPVPDKATVCGLFPAVSVNVKVAVRGPVVVGVNVMSTVQLADGARPDPHALPEIVKSPGFVPVTATLLREIEVPPFCNVVDCDGPLEPTLTVPKERDEGSTPAAVVPLPESETVSVDMPPV
jgi:hypothetical protein